MADWNALSTQTEKRILREVGLEVIALADKARGITPEQHGQRRMANRVLSIIVQKLADRGDFSLDDGESHSEDNIDRSLLA